jgi:hypothetical protein
MASQKKTHTLPTIKKDITIKWVLEHILGICLEGTPQFLYVFYYMYRCTACLLHVKIVQFFLEACRVSQVSMCFVGFVLLDVCSISALLLFFFFFFPRLFLAVWFSLCNKGSALVRWRTAERVLSLDCTFFRERKKKKKIIVALPLERRPDSQNLLGKCLIEMGIRGILWFFFFFFCFSSTCKWV